MAGVIESSHHTNVHHEGSLYDLRSAPGVIQPEFQNQVNFDDTESFFNHDGYNLPQEDYNLPEVKPEEYHVPEVKHDEYGLPEVKHDEYGLPEVKHEEYGPPIERIQPVVTTEQYEIFNPNLNLNYN